MVCTSLNGLNSLKTSEVIEIKDNPALISMEGLNSLTTINQHFEISNNQSLSSLNGLNNLKSVYRNFWIVNNGSLNSLTGLNSLEKVDEVFRITSYNVCYTKLLRF